jgi:hypothetical protein
MPPRTFLRVGRNTSRACGLMRPEVIAPEEGPCTNTDYADHDRGAWDI